MEGSEEQRLESLAESVAQLLQKQGEFDERLALIEAKLRPSPRPSQATAPPPPEPPAAQIFQPKPIPQRGLETKVGLTILNRVGVVTLILGVAFFFKWAVDNDWIGPVTRVLLGFVAGLLLIGLADLSWRKKQGTFAQGLLGGGVAILYLSSYAAYGFYHLVGQATGFLLLLAVTAVCILLSLRYNSPAITALGLVGGYLTPILLSSGNDHPWFLFTYIVAMNLAAAALSERRNWKALEILSFTGTALIYGSWLVSRFRQNENELVAILALVAFYAVFWRARTAALIFFVQTLASLSIAAIAKNQAAVFFPVSLALAAAGLARWRLRHDTPVLPLSFVSFWLAYGAFVGQSQSLIGSLFAGITIGFLLFFASVAYRKPQALGLTVLGADGLVYYAAAYFLLNPGYHNTLGLLAIGLAFVYLGYAAWLQRQPVLESSSILLSLGMAAVFAAIAVAVQFVGFTITIVWSLEAALLSWLARRFTSTRPLLLAALLWFLVLFRIVVWHGWFAAGHNDAALFFNERFLTFAVAGSGLLFSSWCARQLNRQVALAEYAAGNVILLWGLSWEIVTWAARTATTENLLSVQTLSLSVLFTLYAVALIGVGVWKRAAVNRISGLLLIGLVIVKLYLFDVWQLSRIYRISAFVLLGVLLISTSFLYSRFRRWIEGWWKEDDAEAS